MNKTMSPAISKKTSVGRWLAPALLVACIGAPATAEAGAVGQNPYNCGNASTRLSRDFNVAGAIMRQELRYSPACGRVGWGRNSHVGGSWPGLSIQHSAWNPGGPSVYGGYVTPTVDASPGREVCAGFHAWKTDGLGRKSYVGWFFAGCYRA